MACGGCGGGGAPPAGFSASGMRWQLMEPGASSSEQCTARDDKGACLSFGTQAAAAAYRDEFGVPGVPMAVLA